MCGRFQPVELEARRPFDTGQHLIDEVLWGSTNVSYGSLTVKTWFDLGLDTMRERTNWNGVPVKTKTRTGALVVVLLILALACDRSPTSPTVADMTGTWKGISTYPNAPFSLHLTQVGGTFRGQYSDALDHSQSVTGTFTSPTFAIVVDFGDAKVNLSGTVLDARTAQGVMFTSALGNQQFPLTMTR